MSYMHLKVPADYRNPAFNTLVAYNMLTQQAQKRAIMIPQVDSNGFADYSNGTMDLTKALEAAYISFTALEEAFHSVAFVDKAKWKKAESQSSSEGKSSESKSSSHGKRERAGISPNAMDVDSQESQVGKP